MQGNRACFVYRLSSYTILILLEFFRFVAAKYSSFNHMLLLLAE